MRPEVIAVMVDGLIPVLAGIYATRAGYRSVGNDVRAEDRLGRFYERYGGIYRVAGPLLIAFGIFRVLIGLARLEG